jgi:protein SCO1/2
MGSIGPARSAPWGKDYLPNVPVVNQDGRTLRFYDDIMKDKIVVLSFIYTSCRDICPVVTARLAQVQDKLADVVGKEIFFVSLSIDPETDTPEKLKAYAEAFGAGHDWQFLTGKPDDINLLRYKLGERSRNLTDHGNTIMLYNDATSEWSRDSAFSDLNVLAANIRTMNPAWNLKKHLASRGEQSAPPMAELPPELPGQTLFLKTCAACHTVGSGNKIGPDLSGVTERRGRDWVVNYLVNPVKMRAQGDPAALELMKQYPAARMPRMSLSEDDASDLIGYVEAMTYGAKADAASGGTDKAAHKHPAGHEHAGHEHHH